MATGIISGAAAGGDPNAPVTTPATTPVAPMNPTPDPSNWFQNALGRSGAPSGLAYWNNRLATSDDHQGVYNDFLTAAKNNGENITQMDLASASQSRPKNVAQPGAAQSTPMFASSQGYTAAPSSAFDSTSVGYTPGKSTASTAGSSGYTAAQLGLTPDMTVAGQIAKINDPNSPIIQQARTSAAQEAAARGLSNSSMAVTAGEDAAYRAALPIAQQDANTNLGIGTLNTNSTNTASGFTADAANKAALENASLGTQNSEQNAQLESQAGQFGAAAKNASSAQNAALNTQNSQFNSGQINLASAATADAANKASLENASLGTQNSQFNAAADNTLAGQRIAQATALGTAGIGANSAFNVATLNANASQNIARINTASNQVIATLDNANKVALTDMQNKNSQLLQTDQGAQSAWSSAFASINNIQNNKDMDATTKATAINNVAALLQNSLTAIGKINSLDLGSLVTFSVNAPAPVDPANNPDFHVDGVG